MNCSNKFMYPNSTNSTSYASLVMTNLGCVQSCSCKQVLVHVANKHLVGWPSACMACTIIVHMNLSYQIKHTKVHMSMNASNIKQ